MDVPMELSRVIISEYGESQVVFLKERQGERSFPILIGINEAMAIDRRLHGRPSPRPMTHDLLANVIEAMGGRIEKIVVNDLRDHVFIATLFIRRGEELIEVDSRPSDAIALGAALNTPIYVAEHVLDGVLKEPVSKEDRVELLRQRLEDLQGRIREVTERLADQGFLTSAPSEMVQEHRKMLKDMKMEYDLIDHVLKKLT
jgi:bifunctional DNase/RNase